MPRRDERHKALEALDPNPRLLPGVDLGLGEEANQGGKDEVEHAVEDALEGLQEVEDLLGVGVVVVVPQSRQHRGQDRREELLEGSLQGPGEGPDQRQDEASEEDIRPEPLIRVRVRVRVRVGVRVRVRVRIGVRPARASRRGPRVPRPKA